MTHISNAINMSFRVDKELKKQADELFKKLGMNTSVAINMFLTQSVRDQGIPFIPSMEKASSRLLKALKEVEAIENGEINPKRYKNFEEVFRAEGVEKVDGVLLDFGVSSHQLDDAERGCSYMAKDAALDMRMDQSSLLTAREVVNTYSVEELTRILREYGEERFAFQIAKNIERARAKAPIETSGQLTEIIEGSIPWKFKQNGPCQRKTFQAIRIEVNGELSGLKECVTGLTRRLKKGGRIAILTFHSLEDRIVKEAFKEMAASCVCPPSFPMCVCGKKREIRIITGKPIVATEEEQSYNSRSKCAKLRVAERITEE